jgi:hypothetical protein
MIGCDMKYFLVSLIFSLGLFAEPLALRYSPQSFDYLFSSQPQSVAELPMVMECMESKYADNPKMQWCQKVGIDLKNMKSFAFTANMAEFIKLKQTRTPEAQLQRIRQWLMFIEYTSAPNLDELEAKYKEKKSQGKNRLNFEKTSIGDKLAYVFPFKQRKYTYAQISPTKWVAGEYETVKKALTLSSSESLLNDSFFINQLESNKETLAFAVHQPKGKVEIAHPMMKTYQGFSGKVTFDEDFIVETELAMEKQEDLKGIESFAKMMMGFAMAKPQMKMSAENFKTQVMDGVLKMTMRVSPETLKAMREQMKKKWAHKRHNHKKKMPEGEAK